MVFHTEPQFQVVREHHDLDGVRVIDEMRLMSVGPVSIPYEPEEELSWVEGGHDVPVWWLGLAIVALGAILALVVSLAALGGHGTNREAPGGISGGMTVTPSPYGPPGPQGGSMGGGVLQ